MKSNKFGVLALLLGVVAAGACSDKTELVIPPDPLNVTVSPANASVEVGSSIQINASVTGGESTTDKSVTWSTSNSSVASISANGNTVTVTGQQAGNVTITATSNADANVNAGASVTVFEENPAEPSVVISRITTVGPTGVVDVPIGNIAGQIDVWMDVDVPQGTEVSRLDLLIGNKVVYSQGFSSDAALDGGSATITAGVNTAAYTISGGVATVEFGNGVYAVTVQLIGPGGTIVAESQGNQFSQLTFNNPNFYDAALTSPTTNCIIGAVWTVSSYWCKGSIGADIVPVIFNGITIASVTLTAAPGGSNTDTSVPFQPSISASSVQGAVVLSITSITSGGQPGPTCVNPHPVLNPIATCVVATWVQGTGGPVGGGATPSGETLVDNVAPTISTFNILPARLCVVTLVACYVNANMDFDPTDDDLIEFADGGVSAGGSPVPAVATFFAGLPGAEIAVTTGADLSASNGGPGETVTAETYVLKVVIVDGLGNTITRWADDDGIGGQTSAGDSDNQKFGYDETSPTHTFTFVDDGSINSMPDGVRVTGALVVYSDGGVGPSGFLTNPVRIKTELWTAAGVTCLNPDSGAGVSCSSGGGFVVDDGLPLFLAGPGAVPDGFYRVTVYVRDASYPGGNLSTQEVVLSLLDLTSPLTLGGITAPGLMAANSNFTLAAALQDAVGLGSFQVSIGYSGGFIAQPRTDLGTFDPEALIGDDTGATQINGFINMVVDNDGTGLPGTEFPATSLTYTIRDLAGHMLRFLRAEDGDGNEPPLTPNDGFCATAAEPPGAATQNCAELQLDVSGNVAGAGLPAAGEAFEFLTDLNGADATHGLFTFGTASPTTICNGFDCGSTPTTTTLTATVTGPVNVFTNPFSKVEFYYLDSEGKWQFAGTAGSPSITDDTVAGLRTLTFAASWNASSPAVRPGGGTVYQVAAFAYNGDGQLMLSTSGAVTVNGS